MRIAIGIQYVGAKYHGWQRQNNLVTIQSEIELALSKVAANEVSIVGSSRTDAGVHAYYQVAHFNTDIIRSEQSWLRGTNHYLPEDIKLLWVKIVDEDFHARFSARSRKYRYVIYNTAIKSPFFYNYSYEVDRILNIESMQKAAQDLLGEQDFQALRGSNCQSKSPIRTIMSANFSNINDFIIFDIHGNAFLHNMIRRIVGVLILIGNGFKPVSWLREVIDSKDNCLSDLVVPAKGLFLMDVQYDNKMYADLNKSYHMVDFFI